MTRLATVPRAEVQRLQARAMSEEQLQRNVMHAAKTLRLKVAHFGRALTPRGKWLTPTRGDAKGFPDLLIVGPSGVLFRELKDQTGRLSPDQKLWIAALQQAGEDVAVWRPADWINGTVQTELDALRTARKQPA